jgi:hypothetical protein
VIPVINATFIVANLGFLSFRQNLNYEYELRITNYEIRIKNHCCPG